MVCIFVWNVLISQNANYKMRITKCEFIMKSNVSNPFITSGYQGVEYFCDRETETKQMLSHLTNGRSVTLVSVRRIGKTGLIKHTLRQLPSGYKGIYLDILPTETLSNFLNVLITAVLNSIPEKQTAGEKIMNFIRSLRPSITFDPLTGQPQVNIDVRPGETTRHLDSVFKLLESYPQRVVIAIDEFQQILQYPEKQTDAYLRSVIQTLNNVDFIFAGSQQHLMTGLFSDPTRPFFQSASFLKIGKINLEAYTDFILHHFSKAKIGLDKEVILEMLEWADIHTYYVQLLCNRVYASGKNRISSHDWKREANDLLNEQEIVFFKYRNLLTHQQWILLKAIAMEGMSFSPTSKDFTTKHSLGNPSTVHRSLQSLREKEMIYSDYNTEGTIFYSVYDLLFRRWVQGNG